MNYEEAERLKQKIIKELKEIDCLEENNMRCVKCPLETFCKAAGCV